MDCSRAEAENIVEQYISGKLSPAHIQEFE
jgi:hypothetical protein